MKTRLALVFLAACGSSDPGQGTSAYMCAGGADAGGSGSRISVSVSGSCASSDITGGKATKLEGEPCTKSEDCKQICCSCAPQSGTSRSVVLCVNGTCATKEQACCALAFSTSCAK